MYVKGTYLLKVHVCSRYIRTSTHSHDKAHDTGTALPEAAIHGATCNSSFPGTLHTAYTSPPTKPQQEIHNRDNLSNNSAIVQGGQVRIENGTPSHSENHFVLFRQQEESQVQTTEGSKAAQILPVALTQEEETKHTYPAILCFPVTSPLGTFRIT